MGLRRMWWRTTWRRRLAALALVAAAAAAASGALPAPPARLDSRVAFPDAHADRLAHLLADFSMQPQTGAWRVEEERGNYSDWRYRVSFECGARCSGEARVHAARAAAGAATHGRAAEHHVALALAVCTHPPLLPLLWLRTCDVVEVEAAVHAAGAGCVLEERARATCGALRVLSGACARALRDHRRDHLARLRHALDQH